MAISMNEIMFCVNVLNTKVVDNFHVLLFLKFNEFRPAGLGVMPFPITLSVSIYFLKRSER